MLAKLFTLSLFINTSLCEIGLQKACTIIKAPIKAHKQTNDIVLIGITAITRSRLQITST